MTISPPFLLEVPADACKIAHGNQTSFENLTFYSPVDFNDQPAAVAKTLLLTADGKFEILKNFDSRATYGDVEIISVHNRDEAFQAIQKQSALCRSYYIPGKLRDDDPEVVRFKSLTGKYRRIKIAKTRTHHKWDRDIEPPCFEETPHYLHMIDFDPGDADLLRLKEAGIDIYKKPEAAARCVVSLYGIPEIEEASVLCQFSSRAGEAGPHDARMHIFFYLTEPELPTDIKAQLLAYAAADTPKLDTSLYRTVQPHFIGDPTFFDEDGNGCPDPLPQRWVHLEGNGDVQPLAMSADAVEAEIGLKVPPKKKYILTKDKGRQAHW